MITRILSACSVLVLVSLTGCHTIEGAGRDVSAAGSGVADVADSTRPYDEHGTRRDNW